MATVNKNFKVKHGLVVEGATGTINGQDILTKAQADIDYIVDQVGGSGVSANTPDTLVLRDANGDFAAGTITAETKLVSSTIDVGSMGTISDDGGSELLIAAATGEDIRLTADDVRVDAVDDFRVNVGGDILLATSGIETGVYVGSIDTGNTVVTDATLDSHIGDATVDGTEGNTVTARISTAATNALNTATAYTDTEISDHSSSTTGVHGVTGDVVGTSDTQTLTNKTLGSGTNLSVNLDMNGNKIEDLGTPTVGTDATTKDYVDAGDTATLGSANSYTDDEVTALDTSLRLYADAAETDAKAYTDTRETAITSAYQLYADAAEADAVSTAAAYTDQAELDAISSAASSAAALYAPLAGATFTGEVVLSADPTQALGAATKQYVDSVAEGLHVHASAVAATTTNVDLATGGLLTVDGVTLVAGNRVLVKSQTDATENGIYVAAAGAWSRADDYNSTAEIQGGDFTFVTGGTTYGSTGWVQVNIVTTLGTDPIEFDQFSGAGEYTAGTGLTLTGTSFAIDETYTATKSYVDGEITDLDTSLKSYADQAEVDAKAYTDLREIAITTSYEAYADQSEADAKTYADGVALAAENNAKAYTDTREIAITTAYQNYADLAEADARLYTDTEIGELTTSDIEEGTNLYFTNQRAIDAVGGTIGDAIDALDTDDIEEGVTNLYFQDARAKTSAADLLTSASLTNITITGTGAGLTITAENGVADSTTDDLAEGTTNKYFTDARAVTANTGLWDTIGSASTAQSNAETFATNAINALDTDDIEEGLTNKYFTDQRALDATVTAYEAAGAVSAHNIETLNVHGIANTAELETQTGAQAKADNAVTSANGYTDSLIGDSTVNGTAGNTVKDRIDSAVAGLVDGAPELLDTLNELAAAIADNPNYATDVANLVAGKQDTLTAGSNIDITGTTISVTGLDTNDVAEGTNLYFTDARAVDALEAVVPNFTEIDINAVATQVAASASATAATANTVYAFAKADYRSAKFLVKVAYGTHTEVSEVLLTLDTSDNVAITEYAIVGTNGTLSEISAAVSGSNVNLTVNPASNATVTVVGTLLV